MNLDLVLLSRMKPLILSRCEFQRRIPFRSLWHSFDVQAILPSLLKAKYPLLEQAVVDYIKEQRKNRQSVTGSMIIRKAKALFPNLLILPLILSLLLLKVGLPGC